MRLVGTVVYTGGFFGFLAAILSLFDGWQAIVLIVTIPYMAVGAGMIAEGNIRHLLRRIRNGEVDDH